MVWTIKKAISNKNIEFRELFEIFATAKLGDLGAKTQILDI